MTLHDARGHARWLALSLALFLPLLALIRASGGPLTAGVAAAQRADVQVWAIGGPGADEARQLVVDASGNEYLAGVFSGSIDVDPGPEAALLAGAGEQDIFVAKYGPDGGVRWAWSVGGARHDEVRALAVDPSGNVYIAGSIVGEVDFAPGDATAVVPGGPSRLAFVAKYDPDGALVWVTPLELAGDSEVLALAFDRTGNAFAAGWTGLTPVTDPAGWASAGPGTVQRGDAFVLRLEPSGRLAWSAVLPTRSEGVAPLALAVDGAGDLYVAAAYTGALRVTVGSGTIDHTSVGGADVALLKLTPAGGLLWSQTVGGPGHDVPGTSGVAVDTDGNVVVTGTFDDLLDAAGDGVNPLVGNGAGDLFVVSFAADGAYRWAASLGGPGRDGGQAVAVDAARYVYVSGWFAGVPTMDPAADGSVLVGRGQNDATDVLLAKFSPSGELAWVRGLGGSVSGPGQSSAGTTLAVDGRGDVRLGGRFFGADVDVDTGPGVAILSSRGASDVFVARFGPDGALLRR